MGSVIPFPGRRTNDKNNTPLLTLFRQLNPLDQLAIVKAAEIVLVARRQSEGDPPAPE